jgi:hypothetical protein
MDVVLGCCLSDCFVVVKWWNCGVVVVMKWCEFGGVEGKGQSRTIKPYIPTQRRRNSTSNQEH